jgi:hypothetical protein
MLGDGRSPIDPSLDSPPMRCGVAMVRTRKIATSGIPTSAVVRAAAHLHLCHQATAAGWRNAEPVRTLPHYLGQAVTADLQVRRLLAEGPRGAGDWTAPSVRPSAQNESPLPVAPWHPWNYAIRCEWDGLGGIA